MFKIEQQIEQQTTSRNRLITILAWNEYQKSEQQNEQQVNNKRTTSEHKQECKERKKNVRNIYDFFDEKKLSSLYDN